MRLPNTLGEECCSGREGDVWHHMGNFTLLRCVWRESMHDEESGIFNSWKKHHGAMGGTFLIWGFPACQMLTPCFTQWEWVKYLKHRLSVFVGVMWRFGSQRGFQGLCLYPSGGGDGGGGEGPGAGWGESWFCRENGSGNEEEEELWLCFVKTKKASRKELGHRGLLGGDWDWPEEDNDADMEVSVQTVKQDGPEPRSMMPARVSEPELGPSDSLTHLCPW